MKKLIFTMFVCLCVYGYAIGIGMVGANGNGSVVIISHAYLDPNGDVSITWNRTTGPDYNYQDIDDGIRPPSKPGADRVYIQAPATSDDVYDMEAAPSGATVTIIKIWVYGEMYPGAATSIDLNIGGGWEGASSLGFTDNVKSWESVTFTGSWSEAQVNAMQVKLLKTAGAGAYPDIWEITAYITYTN